MDLKKIFQVTDYRNFLRGMFNSKRPYIETNGVY